MIIRHVEEADADSLLRLTRRLDEETEFMMLEPGERTTTVEEQRSRIQGLKQRPNQAILVAEEAGQLMGYIALMGGSFRRNRHSAYIVAGVLQAFAGRGIGRQLFTEGERWARQVGLRRLELTVMAHNQRAIALYSKMGFRFEGTKRDSLCVGGLYVDEYYMAKLLD
ncbi:MAG: GNAT family N-acetyltransferase [Bacillota bacterium]